MILSRFVVVEEPPKQGAATLLGPNGVVALTANVIADEGARCLVAGINERLKKDQLNSGRLGAALERRLPAPQSGGGGMA